MGHIIRASEWVARGRPDGATIRAGSTIVERSLVGAPLAELQKGGELDFRITTPVVDRMNDRILAEGGTFANYLRNPVILFGHDYRGIPAGRALDVRSATDGVLSRGRFLSKEENPFGNLIFVLIVRGDLNAVSVGIKPLKIVEVPDRRGYDYAEWDLLEYSVVPLPANPEALVLARSQGVDLAPLEEWMELTLADAEMAMAGDEGAVQRLRRRAVLHRTASGILVPEGPMTKEEVERLEAGLTKVLGDISAATAALSATMVTFSAKLEEATRVFATAAASHEAEQTPAQSVGEQEAAQPEQVEAQGAPETPEGGGDKAAELAITKEQAAALENGVRQAFDEIFAGLVPVQG